jgi:hypothetical protein
MYLIGLACQNAPYKRMERRERAICGRQGSTSAADNPADVDTGRAWKIMQ